MIVGAFQRNAARTALRWEVRVATTGWLRALRAMVRCRLEVAPGSKRWEDGTMALFKRRKYSPPEIGTALDPYHYPEGTSGKPSAAPSAGAESAPVSESQPERVADHDETKDRPPREDD